MEDLSLWSLDSILYAKKRYDIIRTIIEDYFQEARLKIEINDFEDLEWEKFYLKRLKKKYHIHCENIKPKQTMIVFQVTLKDGHQIKRKWTLNLAILV